MTVQVPSTEIKYIAQYRVLSNLLLLSTGTESQTGENWEI